MNKLSKQALQSLVIDTARFELKYFEFKNLYKESWRLKTFSVI